MVPVQRKSRSQSKQGRAHHGMRPIHAVRCPNCGASKRPHAACAECGYVRPGLKIQLTKED